MTPSLVAAHLKAPLSWPQFHLRHSKELSLPYDEDPSPSEVSRFAALVAAPWFGRSQRLDLGGCPLGTVESFDGTGLRALAGAPLPNISSLSLSTAHLSPLDVTRVLANAP